MQAEARHGIEQYDFDKRMEAFKEACQARLQKKFKNNLKRMEAVQKISLHQSPLGLLRAMARLDGRK